MKPIENLIRDLSSLINQKLNENYLLYDKNRIVDNWLGAESATGTMIRKREEELQIKLPRSYIKFLKISNGFKQVSPFTGRLYPISKIDWIHKLEPDLLESYKDMEDYDSEISDEILADYTEGNNTQWRYSDLEKTIIISDWGDATILMLNPNSKNKDDYEVWEFGTWLTGAIRYKNFHHFLDSKIRETRELLNK